MKSYPVCKSCGDLDCYCGTVKDHLIECPAHPEAGGDYCTCHMGPFLHEEYTLDVIARSVMGYQSNRNMVALQDDDHDHDCPLSPRRQANLWERVRKSQERDLFPMSWYAKDHCTCE